MDGQIDVCEIGIYILYTHTYTPLWPSETTTIPHTHSISIRELVPI